MDLTQTTLTKPHPLLRDGLILGGLWGVMLAFDLTWIALDQSVPAWDQGDHLSRALNHWRVLQHPQWFSSSWWRELWQQAPTQRAPLVYLATVPLFALFGGGFDQGIWVNQGFALILMIAIYLTGRRVGSRQLGLWAAGLSLLSPELTFLRLDYLLDFGMTAVYAVTFAALTFWWLETETRRQWLLTGLLGATVALSLLTRTSALLFLLVPLGWMGGVSLWQRRWQRLLQGGSAIAITLILIWPWFSTSWLTIITTTLDSSGQGLTYRNDPQANTLAGWLYYLWALPSLVSLPILAAALGSSVVVKGLETFRRKGAAEPGYVSRDGTGWRWLAGFILAIYLLGSLATYKAPRIIVPAMSPLLILLAQALTARPGVPWRRLRYGAVGLSLLLLLPRIWPVPFTDSLTANQSLHRPYRGDPWPNAAVAAAVAADSPWLRANLGMVTNTQELNPQNMDFFGGLTNFQVAARQLGFKPESAASDAAALNWYLTKTGDQGVYGPLAAGQVALKDTLLADPNLTAHQHWTLPDGSQLTLQRRRSFPVTVSPLSTPAPETRITTINVPAQVTIGQASPITYEIQGPWTELQQGLLLLTWEPQGNSQAMTESPWVSDHAIGLGQLYARAQVTSSQAAFAITEQLALWPPATVSPGLYHLQAQYLDSSTGQSQSIALPPTQVTLVAPAVATPVSATATIPPLDLVTRLRQLAAGLATGEIDSIFSEVNLLNQYDPVQAYLSQTEQLMQFRAQQSARLDWLYPLALAQVLQQDAKGAIATLHSLTQIAPENPHHWAYLGFLELYRWHPQRAQAALDEAARLNPELPNLSELQLAAAIMQLNLPRAWTLIQTL